MLRSYTDESGKTTTFQEKVVSFWSLEYYKREQHQMKSFADFLMKLETDTKSFTLSSSQIKQVYRFLKDDVQAGLDPKNDALSTEEIEDSASISPETDSKAPEVGDGAPGAGNGAPEAGDGAPEAGNGAPEVGDGAPEAGDGAPEAGNGAPEAGDGAPRVGDGAPEPTAKPKRRKLTPEEKAQREEERKDAAWVDGAFP